MLVRFTKNSPGAAADTLTCIHADGSITKGNMPRQGVLPQAAICFVVESTLGWRDAFFGNIARGGKLKPQRKQPRRGETQHEQRQQADALVECLEAGLWSGAPEPAVFQMALHAACHRRAVAPPLLPAGKLEALRTALREFGAAWRPLNPGQSIERTF
jgi:hypothetical protein